MWKSFKSSGRSRGGAKAPHNTSEDEMANVLPIHLPSQSFWEWRAQTLDAIANIAAESNVTVRYDVTISNEKVAGYAVLYFTRKREFDRARRKIEEVNKKYAVKD